jgi:tRNA threonylcarbamoyladenosine biosynthesis protein TsaE
MTLVPLNELSAFARDVRATLMLLPPHHGATVVYLRGDLGAGKTSFVQALAKEFGVEGVVQSPTYTLMRSYDVPGGGRYATLVHIDAYRLERPEEFAALRPEEFLNKEGTLALIEWPERIEEVGPKPDLVVSFSSDGTGPAARRIELLAPGVR